MKAVKKYENESEHSKLTPCTIVLLISRKIWTANGLQSFTWLKKKSNKNFGYVLRPHDTILSLIIWVCTT